MKWKKRLIDAGILAAVFVVAVIVFGYFTNKGNNSMTADMGAATYPQISFSYNGYNLNTLPGYARKMDITAMRDTITPVNAKKLDLKIQKYGNKIEKLHWEIYTLDGKDSIQKDEVKKPGEEASLDLSAENLLAEERVLELCLTVDDGKEIYFYTRIADASSMYVLESLDYIRAFHENAMGKVEGAGVGAAIEPSEEGDNSSFHHVTIHSDYDQVSWGDLEPVVEQGERWRVTEINESSVSVRLEYNVSCKGEENETDGYKVKEFFRVRYIPDTRKTYLLDYDRTMDQIFDPTKQVLSEKGVLLGITGKKVPYMVNKDGVVVSFIVADELWNYNKKTDEVSQVFSFASAENTDVRNLIGQHELELLEMDGKGNTTFGVYGYMNRGEHEGEVGAAIYYYDIEKNSVDERVFISSNKSYGNAVNELSRLLYYSVDRDMLYTMVGGSLYEYDVKIDVGDVLIEGLEEGQYVVSDDGHLAAYQEDGSLNTATKIKVMNLETGEEQEVTCEEGECIRPLGFMKNDFVYGVARTEDVGRTVSGEATAPMYKVEIQSPKGEVVKTYQNDGVYVLDTVFEENMITLNRASKDGGTYTSIAPDYITNNEEKEESNIYLETYVTDLKETQVRLTYANGISDKEPKILRPKQVLFENPRVINFADMGTQDSYYVYGYGELQGSYGTAGEAVRAANACNGVVVSAAQQYIWERGNRSLSYTISGKENVIENIRSRLMNGETPVDIMKNINGGEVLDLTGCTTEELLYIINQDRPVIGMLDSENAAILVGYDEAYVIYVDVASGERRSAPYAEMDQMTGVSGNIYIG